MAAYIFVASPSNCQRCLGFKVNQVPTIELRIYSDFLILMIDYDEIFPDTSEKVIGNFPQVEASCIEQPHRLGRSARRYFGDQCP